MPDYSYQDQAIKNIINDFSINKTANNLLVIPTGGGKTITALRALYNLVELNLIGKNDIVIWATHRKALKSQTKEELNSQLFQSLVSSKKTYRLLKDKILKICMNSEAQKIVFSQKYKNKVKFLVLDEAHHSGANSYQDFFTLKCGILGLTATPNRNDDNKLKFDKIIYTISAQKLIKSGVILMPNILNKRTNINIDFHISNKEPNSSYDQKFNTSERNQKIVKYLYEDPQATENYKKVMVHTRTKKHAKNIYNEIIEKYHRIYPNQYQNIEYIFGNNENSSSDFVSNEDFLDAFREKKNGIIIHCGVLEEGYNDPTIDTLILTVPIGSEVQFTQIVGRALRSGSERANIVQFSDKYPSLEYRINNGWIFNEINTALQPKIFYHDFSDKDQFREIGLDILASHSIDSTSFIDKIKNIFDKNELEELRFILFNSTEKIGKKSWKVILTTTDFSKDAHIELYNTLSLNVNNKSLPTKNTEYWPDYYPFIENDAYLSKNSNRIDFLNALELASKEIKGKTAVARLKYYIFDYRPEIDSELENFLKNVENSRYVKNKINIMENHYILKLPSQLNDKFFCIFIKNESIAFVKDYLLELRIMESDEGIQSVNYSGLIIDFSSKLKELKIPLMYLRNLELLLKLEMDKNEDSFLYKI